MIRAGLLLGAVAALLAALASTGDLVSGPARGGGDGRLTVEVWPAIPAAIVAAALVGAAFVPWLWAQLAGPVLITMVTASAGLIVVSGRTSDDFADGADIALEGGGLLLTLSFWLGLVAIALTLVGFRRQAMAIDPAGEDGDAADGPSGSNRATLALVLGIAGFITIIAAPLAVALGTLALGDIRASGGQRRGRGSAVAGVVLGIIALSLLAALVGLGTVAASPGD